MPPSNPNVLQCDDGEDENKGDIVEQARQEIQNDSDEEGDADNGDVLQPVGLFDLLGNLSDDTNDNSKKEDSDCNIVTLINMMKEIHPGKRKKR